MHACESRFICSLNRNIMSLTNPNIYEAAFLLPNTVLVCISLSVFVGSGFERRRGSLRFGLEQFVSVRGA